MMTHGGSIGRLEDGFVYEGTVPDPGRVPRIFGCTATGHGIGPIPRTGWFCFGSGSADPDVPSYTDFTVFARDSVFLPEHSPRNSTNRVSGFSIRTQGMSLLLAAKRHWAGFEAWLPARWTSRATAGTSNGVLRRHPRVPRGSVEIRGGSSISSPAASSKHRQHRCGRRIGNRPWSVGCDLFDEGIRVSLSAETVRP